MIITHARWDDAGQAVIRATVDGGTLYVPPDPENAVYAAIIASGIEIGPYSGPAQPPAVSVSRAPGRPLSVIRVPPNDIEEIWNMVAGPIDEACAATGSVNSAEQWRERFSRGNGTLWLMTEGEQIVGLFVTECYDTARGKTCGVPVVYGDLRDLQIGLDAIMQEARDSGCVRVEGFARDGWIRALQQHGWRPIATVLEVAI